MKILMVIENLPTNANIDGTTRWFINVASALIKEGHTVEVIGGAMGDNESLLLAVNHIHSVSEPHKRNYFKMLSGWDYSKIRVFNPAMSALLTELCTANAYDLVMLVGIGVHVYLPYVKAAHVMAAPLDSLTGVSSPVPTDFMGKMKSLVNKYLVRISEHSLTKADSVLVVSNKDKQLLQKSGVKTQIIVNEMGVDTEYFAPEKAPTKTTSILFTGVLDFQPNIDAALHLAHDIFIGGGFAEHGYTLNIAGKNPVDEILQLDQLPGICVHANVPDLRSVFNDAEIYAAPMRTGLGMKNKILEAMAMEMPIIGYPLAFNGFHQPEQFAIICDTTDDMIASLYDLLQNADRKKLLREKARQVAIDRYGVQSSTRKMLAKINR